MIPIRQIFSLGARCNTDHLLKKMGLRRFSSPFSFMLINGATAAHFIRQNFHNYTSDLHRVDLPHSYRWGGRSWPHNLFFNLIHPKTITVTDIDELDEMAIWNHHDFTAPEIQEALRRRETRLLNALNNTPSETLLLYIAKPRLLANDPLNQRDVFAIKKLTEDFHCHALILLPYLDFKKAPKHFPATDKLNLISYHATWSNDVKESAIEWPTIEK